MIKEHKESLLEALASTNKNLIKDALVREFDFLYKGETSPDFLELLPYSTLLECMQILGDLFDQNILKTSNESSNNFRAARNRRFDKYITALNHLIDNPHKHSQVNTFVHTKRKYMGMSDNIVRIKELSRILQYADSKGLLDRKSIAIIHYPGTFNPFPHKGHIEAARMAQLHASRFIIEQHCRIVISTNAIHPGKPHLSSTFYQRLDNLQRGFFNEEYASVLGIVGDFEDKHQRMHQLSLIAQFDFEKRLRFLLGSDRLLSSVRQAIKGDGYYQFLLNAENQIFVSPRISDDYKQLVRSIHIAKQAFHSDIILLPRQHEAISSTLVRFLSTQRRRKFAPNKYVRLKID